MAIELECSDRPAPVVILVGLALDGVVGGAPLVDGAPVGDEIGEEGEPHLDEPGAMEGEAGRTGDAGGGGSGASDGEQGGDVADEDGHEEEIEVAVLDAVKVLSAEVEEEELLTEGEEEDEIEEG